MILKLLDNINDNNCNNNVAFANRIFLAKSLSNNNNT